MSSDDWLKIIAVAVVGACVTGIFAWLRGLLEKVGDNTLKVAFLRSQMDILWGAMEATALGALHHRVQPEMDAMLEGYALGTLDMDQLRQFIARLRVIAEGASNAPEQVPQARLILVGAEQQLKTRLEHPELIDAAQQALQDEADRRVAELTASEARQKPPGWRPVTPPGEVPPEGVTASLTGTVKLEPEPEPESKQEG